MVAAVAALGAITIVWGERIGVNGDQGWDGMAYAEWARDIARAVDQGLTKYQAQRVLPSAIVDVMGGRAHAVDRFQLFDALALIAAAFAWTRIAVQLAWSRAASWAGFVAVFASFAIARHALYYPTLTDSAAFALGTAMTWAYLADRPIVLGLVGLASAFTWPPSWIVALGLLVLRRRTVEPIEARWIRPTAALVAAAGAIVACGVALHYLDKPAPGDVVWVDLVPRGLLWITLPCLAVWTGFAWYALACRRRSWNVVAYARSIADVRLVLAVVAVVAVVVVRAWWIAKVGTRGPGPTRDQFACELAVESLRGPLWDLVHHVVYYGPIVIVAVAGWRKLAATADEWGPGAVLVLAMVVAFAIGSESRQWIHLFPFVVATAITATASWWTPRRTIVFAALCLVWSKLWWPMRYDTPLDPFSWPNLRYYMQHGPWASDTTFAIHAAAVAVTAGVLVVLHRRRVA